MVGRHPIAPPNPAPRLTPGPRESYHSAVTASIGCINPEQVFDNVQKALRRMEIGY